MVDPKIKDIISRVNISQQEAAYVIKSYIKEKTGRDVDFHVGPSIRECTLFQHAYSVSEEFFAKKLYNVNIHQYNHDKI